MKATILVLTGFMCFAGCREREAENNQSQGGVTAVSSEKPPTRMDTDTDKRKPDVPLTRVANVEFDWEDNFAGGVPVRSEDGKRSRSILQAIDVSDLEESQSRDTRHVRSITGRDRVEKPLFAVWRKDGRGYRFVDKNVFTDLLRMEGDDAEKFDVNGNVIGRVKLKKYDPVDLAAFLVATGVVDVNLHRDAHVSGVHYSSPAGHWFSLDGVDPYWTNRRNLQTYDFGFHFADDGTIRLINKRYVGFLPKEKK